MSRTPTLRRLRFAWGVMQGHPLRERCVQAWRFARGLPAKMPPPTSRPGELMRGDPPPPRVAFLLPRRERYGIVHVSTQCADYAIRVIFHRPSAGASWHGYQVVTCWMDLSCARFSLLVYHPSLPESSILGPLPLVSLIGTRHEDGSVSYRLEPLVYS